MELNQETITAAVAIVGWLSLIAGTVAGMFKSKRATGVKGFFLKAARLVGNNTYADQTGTSIPFLPIDVGNDR